MDGIGFYVKSNVRNTERQELHFSLSYMETKTCWPDSRRVNPGDGNGKVERMMNRQ